MQKNKLLKRKGTIRMNFNLLFAFILMVITIVPNMYAQVIPQYQNITTQFTKTVSLNYLVYIPPNYRPSESSALLLYLTGLEGIDDINMIRDSGPPKAVESGMEYDYFIVAPQLPGDVHWDPDALNALMDELNQSYNIDNSRCYITGIGDRGGWGVYEFCVSYPGIFKKIAPIGAAACTEICRIGNASTWIFHGELDEVVPVEDAENMFFEIDYYCGTDCQLTVYDSLGHNIWDQVYSGDSLWQWLFGSVPTYGGNSPQPTIKSFSKEITKDIDDDYLLYLPVDYSSTETDWPLMIFLHGAGSAITNINAIREVGPPMLYEQGMDSNFVLVCPQLYDDVHWDVDRLYTLTNYIIDNYNIDLNRIYITGLSRGGFGTWEFAVSYPNLFAAVVPISARDVPGVERLVNSNIWIFHGALDDGVPWQGSQFMYNRLVNISANANLTMYPGVGHWAWIPAYETDSLWTWILAQNNVNTIVSEQSMIDVDFELSNSYPNPFNLTTTIHYKIPNNSLVNLTIYDTTGRVTTILRNEYQTAGDYVIQWHGLDSSGKPVSSGIYYYQLKTNGNIHTKKMILLK
jgi:predicted peptidase